MFFKREHSADRRHSDQDRDGGRSRGGEGHLDNLYSVSENAQLLFVGSVNCLRHKPYMQIGQKMAEGKAALLCPSMSDFSTGRYVNQIYDAIVELSQERNTKNFVLAFGCQWVILSTDADLITERLEQEHGIKVVLYDDSHLDEDDHH